MTSSVGSSYIETGNTCNDLLLCVTSIIGYTMRRDRYNPSSISVLNYTFEKCILGDEAFVFIQSLLLLLNCCKPTLHAAVALSMLAV